ITDNLPKESLLKVYISIASRIFDDTHNVLLTKRNMRFLRRAVRDYQFRNSSIENTYKLWDSVQYGENEYLFPYKHLADIMVDSFHSYEPCIFKTIATALFQELPKESEHYDECQDILAILDKFVAIPTAFVPQDSLLREFIGR
ncbi:MAG: nucleoside kinase, partial [Oscillospiraceae bacterium]